MGNKIGRIIRIFEGLEHLKSRGVTLWAKRIGPVVVTITDPILLAHNVTPRLLRCSSPSNILMILPILLLTVY